MNIFSSMKTVIIFIIAFAVLSILVGFIKGGLEQRKKNKAERTEAEARRAEEEKAAAAKAAEAEAARAERLAKAAKKSGKRPPKQAEANRPKVKRLDGMKKDGPEISDPGKDQEK